jgi:hypothetical protein
MCISKKLQGLDFNFSGCIPQNLFRFGNRSSRPAFQYCSVFKDHFQLYHFSVFLVSLQSLPLCGGLLF